MLVFSFTARANWQGRNHKMVAFDVRCHYLSHGQAVEEMWTGGGRDVRFGDASDTFVV